MPQQTEKGTPNDVEEEQMSPERQRFDIELRQPPRHTKPSKKRLTEELPLMFKFRAADLKKGLKSHSSRGRPLKYHLCCKGFTSGTAAIGHLGHAGEGERWGEYKVKLVGSRPGLQYLLAKLKLKPEELVFVDHECRAGKRREFEDQDIQDEYEENLWNRESFKARLDNITHRVEALEAKDKEKGLMSREEQEVRDLGKRQLLRCQEQSTEELDECSDSWALGAWRR